MALKQKIESSVPRGTSDPSQLIVALQSYLPSLAPSQCQTLALHYDLLSKWNKTHNLTRITSPADAALLHYVDSLLPLMRLDQPRSIVDIGSGTGLPGIAAAIWWPAAKVVLVDSSAKKVSFLRAVKAHLGAANLVVVQGRCESIAPQQADLALVRATFQWPQLPGLVGRHLAGGGQLLAYLGQAAPSESDWSQVIAKANLVHGRLEKYFLPVENQVRHAAFARKE